MGGLPNANMKSKRLSMLHIFKEKLLMDFISNGVSAIEKCPDISEVFLTLLNFLHDQEIHERAIRKISGDGGEETSIALGQHLFSQLIPSKDFVVDHQARQIPEICTCGCEAKIQKGNTDMGSHFTWHGRVDILLNQAIAVAIFDDKKEDPDKEDAEEWETNSEEPPAKKTRSDYEGKQKKSEVETNKRSDILVEEDILQQILAESITNGFTQVNMNKALSGFLIPTFGFTAESVSVCLYDSVNDILLQNIQPMDLWTCSYQKLNILTIVTVWLFLNFTIFGKRNLMEKINLDKSGFHNEMGQSLLCYRQIKTEMCTSSPCTPYWYQAMEFCETVYPSQDPD